MELKSYQKDVINNLRRYLELMSESNNYVQAYRDLMTEQNIKIGFGGVPDYKNTIPNTPHVCFKVPTGGGKTFLACNSIRPIMEAMPLSQPKVVVWLVPSDPILEQTIRTLSDVHHPYRQKIDIDFGGKVEVITKQMALSGQNFNPITINESLTILVMSYDSFRITNKEGRKVYQENGALAQFAKFYNNTDALVADCDETALAQVLNWLKPLVIVDESHHATSSLSIDVLNVLNPCFILDLTATPKSNSNIIAYVDAMKLKAEHMVKLPVIVYNRKSQKDVIRDAIDLRGNLENAAIAEKEKTGKYIRPIVLFQAQPRNNEESTTFEKIKNILIDAGIPEEQIAIKTSNNNELKNIDLLNEECPIRYIITIDALKEGWDCPFAYILATVANRSSVVDVEQILGRVLRQPYTKEHTAPFLNMSYALTCSDDFRTTIEKIVSGLNRAGFSKHDMRLGENAIDHIQEETSSTIPVQTTFEDVPIGYATDDTEKYDEDLIDVDVTELKKELSDINTNHEEPSSIVSNMFETALTQSQEYNTNFEFNTSSEYNSTSMELRDKMNLFWINTEFEAEINTISVPQFFIKTEASLFSNENYELLTKEVLTDGFTLRDKSSEIVFTSANEQIVKIDIEGNKDVVPKSAKLNEWDTKAFKKYFSSLAPESRVKVCKDAIKRQLDKIKNVDTADLSEYVDRIVASMKPEMLEDMEGNINKYSDKIKEKIKDLQEEYAKSQFYTLLETRKIVCKPSYLFPERISPLNSIDSLTKSLYTSEDGKMNDFEYTTISAIAALDNIKWWHRVTDRKGFCINGYINHYPDFIIMTKKGMLVAIETKGDYLVDDALPKIDVGRTWQDRAGNDKYAYYMVFEHRDLDLKGAYYLDEFIDIIKEL